MQIGAKRSPLHTPAQVAALAREIGAREELVLDGIMAYEGQIAGVGDRPPGKPLMALAVRAMQALSARELAVPAGGDRRRGAEVAPLRFVNGGGTGSIERTAAEPAVTEVAAGSGLFGPTLFDAYRAFTPAPGGDVRAAGRAPPVGRDRHRAGRRLHRASGAAGRDRLPRPFFPPGLKLDKHGGRRRGPDAAARRRRGLRVGDRVWFRHAKAGELCERFDVVHLLQGGELVDSVPTYRGEGKTFL